MTDTRELLTGSDLADALDAWHQPFDCYGDDDGRFDDALFIARTEQTELLAASILAAAAAHDTVAVGTPFAIGGLTYSQGSWPAGTEQTADAAGPAGSAEWFAVLRATPFETVTLTADGLCRDSGWCGQSGHVRCGGGDEMIAVERWGATGREFHGFLCSACRRLAQSG